MIKILALNQIASNNNEDEYANTLSKEAQEQVALNEYNRALGLLLNNKKEEALKIFRDLLNTELLDGIEKPPICDGRSRPMVSLKYSCFKNIASIQIDLNDYDGAVNNYCQAAALDDSDVNLWYKIGITAIKIYNLELACIAFKQGLKKNYNHWPCLDNIITVLYAIPDYMNCLLYISLALEKDATYAKGLVFRQHIFNNIPSLRDCYKDYNISWIFDPPLDIDYDKAIHDLFIKKASKLNQKWISETLNKVSINTSSNLFLRKILTDYSWLELAKLLIEIYQYINDNNFNFATPICLYNYQLFQALKTKKVFKEDTYSFTNDKYSNLDMSLEHISSLHEVSDIYEENKIITNEIQLIKANSDEISNCKLDLRNFNILSSNFKEMQEDKSNYFRKHYTDENLCESNKIKPYDLNLKIDCKFNENDQVSKLDDKDKNQKARKRRRSSLCFLTQWAWSNSSAKRPSRGRTSNRKDYEKDGIALEDILKRIFPPTLISDSATFIKEESLKKNEDSLDPIDLYYLIANKDNSADDAKSTESSKSSSPASEEQSKYFGTRQEEHDIEEFLKMHNNNSNIMVLLAKFVDCLCSRWNYEWPSELPELYIQSYLYMRKHSQHCSPFVHDITGFFPNPDAQSTLLFGELYIDSWLSTSPGFLLEPSLYRLGIGISSDELGCIIFYNRFDESYNEENLICLLRLLWFKANILLYQGDIEISIKTLELMLYHIQNLRFNFGKPFIKLSNCKYNSVISMRTVQMMLTSIQRSKKFCEIKNLYQEKKYEELSFILKETFNIAKQTNQFFLCKDMLIDRVEHLEMLLNSLWQLQQYEDCYVWAEACLHESWHSYLHIINMDDEKGKWARSVLYALEKLDACILQASTFVVKYLSNFRLSRLVQNLVHIVCHQLDVLDNTPTMSVETVLPWIILHSILQYEEDKQKSKLGSKHKYKSHTFVESVSYDDENIPASIMILLKAHEFLGRHGWCCISGGKLLIFIMRLLIPKLCFPPYCFIKQKLKEPLEQIIYCLYGHPSKVNNGIKMRPKYLDEHVKCHMSLTWEMCQLLFDFYVPEKFPTFESKRIDSINSDTANLFKRICAFFPPENDPTQLVEEMNSYLSGNREKIPSIKIPLCHKISHVYYLLGDYYFKTGSNQSWSIAVKYYILDLCLHPNELNSWAGLAMSTSTLMETWLNNFQPNINEEKYLKKAKTAERSYQHAIELAPSHLTIWTEFGNFLYTVHSFCSRLLKQESDSLNMERFRILENRKEEMLDKAKNCFLSANHIFTSSREIDELQDERWLYQYMLAKISEKKNEDPPVFLKHYSKASEFLFKNHAEYPKRISHKNPQNLAIEALEVYYRIHASILKYLEQHENKPVKKSLAFIFRHSLNSCIPVTLPACNSICINKLAENRSNSNRKHFQLQKICPTSADNKLYRCKSSTNTMQETNLLKQAEYRKRYCNDSEYIGEEKSTKLSGVSHLKLMQDVVALIDEMITEVCNKVSDRYVRLKCTNNERITQMNCQYKFSSSVTTINYSEDRNLINNLGIDVEAEGNQLLTEAENPKTMHSLLTRIENLQPECFHKISKIDEKKRFEKLEESLTRRNSQESTTTTQTSTSETNNSTSNSSTDSSSSDDSSDTSLSSDSDSDSLDSDAEKKTKIIINEDTYLSEKETNGLIECCIAGLEQCVLRFPEHYKSIYRLAYFFFYSKTAKSIDKCKQLLLGSYQCQMHPNETIQGLFAERKNANFFNGIWRIPIHEIDRPGSFASHMSRCILLLMQVLKETGDSRMLTELCIQLRKIPDTDKKYLRDTEREQLSCQALTLCLQCLRNRMKSSNAQIFLVNDCGTYSNEKILVLMDVYYTFQSIKNLPEYETSELPKVQKLLETAYMSCTGNNKKQGNIFESAKEFCRQKIRAKKIGIAEFNFNTSTQEIGPNLLSPILEINSSSSMNASLNTQIRKSQKMTVTGRPRGRPPGMNKFSQMINNDSLLTQNQCGTKSTPGFNTFKFQSNNEHNKTYNLKSMLEPNMLAAMFTSGIDGNMINSAVNYFNQIGAYQEVFHQYQSNLNAISHINYNKMDSDNICSAKLMQNIASSSNNLSIIKERPDLSITPVSGGNIPYTKTKEKNLLNDNTANKFPSSIIKYSKTPNTSKSDFSSLKSCHYRYSQSFVNNDISPSANSLISGIMNHSVNSQSNQTTLTTFNSSSSDTSQPGTSLQHKLLSKKRNQTSQHRTATLNSRKKYKQNKTLIPNSYYNPSNSGIFCRSPGFNTFPTKKINPISTMPSESESHLKKILKSNTENLRNTIPSAILTQLKQQAHLEIIPQTLSNSTKSKKIIPNNFEKTVPAQSFVDIDVLTTNGESACNLPKRKICTNISSTHQTQKSRKLDKDTVEIITLDD